MEPLLKNIKIHHYRRVLFPVPYNNTLSYLNAKCCYVASWSRKDLKRISANENPFHVFCRCPEKGRRINYKIKNIFLICMCVHARLYLTFVHVRTCGSSRYESRISPFFPLSHVFSPLREARVCGCYVTLTPLLSREGCLPCHLAKIICILL